MRKIIAVIISILLVFPSFSGLFAFAQQNELANALLMAETELYGLYTARTANYLRDSYNKAVANSDPSCAEVLLEAVKALTPLSEYIRYPLSGFSKITEEDVANMPLIKGHVSLSDGFVTLSGEGKLRYSNASDNGVTGASPFAMETSAADGFVLKISASSNALLTITVGRRGGNNDCAFIISDIMVSEGEDYYFFDFDLFGNLPLDGTLNYISLEFIGAASVTFGDLHAANNTETAAKREYKETPFNGTAFNSENYYKILQKGTNLALTMLDEDGENGRFAFTESEESNENQEWQIVRDTVDTNTYRIINKKYGEAFHYNGSDTPGHSVPTLTDKDEEWRFSYAPARGYAIFISNRVRLSYTMRKVRLTEFSPAIKYFDIVEIEGERWNQVWSDEFEFLDESIWNVYDNKHRADTEPFYAKPENVYIENDNLVIKTKVEEYKGYHATSGWMETNCNLYINYGRIEMSAKLPEGHKIWPAFWLMGDNDTWPYCGEIDIMEMVGSGEQNEWRGDKESIATVHWADDTGAHVDAGGWWMPLINDNKLSEDYHIYALEWEADQLRWYFDDVLYFTFNITTDAQKHALSNNPMFILLDTSISGPGNNELPENMPPEAYYYIDYIRYYRPAEVAETETLLPSEENVLTETYCENIWSPTVNDNSFTVLGDTYVYTNYAANLCVSNMSAMSSKRNTLSGSSWSLTNAISADATRVASGHTKGHLISVDLKNDALPYNKVTTGYRHNILAVSDDGSKIYTAPAIAGYTATAGDVCYFRIYDAETLEILYTEELTSKVRMIKVAPNGCYAFVDYSGGLKLRSAENEIIGEYKLEGYGTDIAFSPDGKKLYAVNSFGKLYCLDVETGEPSVLNGLSPDEAYNLTVSFDGKYVAVAYGDSCARIFDAETGKLVARPSYGVFAVMSVAFSPDGKLFAMGGNDGRIIVYDTLTWLPVITLKDSAWEHSTFDTVCFSADGKKIFSSTQVWDFDSRVLCWELPEDIIFSGSDFSALEELGYEDELSYTAESYEAYVSALAKASAVKNNRYSTQEQIDEAATALQKAKSALVEKPDYMKGDFDFDGKITVADALAALRIAARMAESSDEAIAIGDIDADGEITVADSLAILRVAARMSDSL